MLNRIYVMGRLTRDPELRHTPSGIPVASFSLAVDRDYKNKETGERGVDFIDVVAWRSTGEFVSKYFTKGRMAVVEGRLQMRDWTDRDGNKRRSYEVMADNVYFGDSRRDGDSGGYRRDSYSGGGSYGGGGYDSRSGGSGRGMPPGDGRQFSKVEDDRDLPFGGGYEGGAAAKDPGYGLPSRDDDQFSKIEGKMDGSMPFDDGDSGFGGEDDGRLPF